MNLKDALAQTLLDFETNPDIWTQGAFAKDAGGDIVTPDDPTATCWCVLGRVAMLTGSNELAWNLMDRSRLLRANDNAVGLAEALAELRFIEGNIEWQ